MTSPSQFALSRIMALAELKAQAVRDELALAEPLPQPEEIVIEPITGLGLDRLRAKDQAQARTKARAIVSRLGKAR